MLSDEIYKIAELFEAGEKIDKQIRDIIKKMDLVNHKRNLLKEKMLKLKPDSPEQKKIQDEFNNLWQEDNKLMKQWSNI